MNGYKGWRNFREIVIADVQRRRIYCQEGKRCMLAFLKTGADFWRGYAHPAMQPPIPAPHPLPRNTKEPEAHCQDSGSKRITSRATVDGALAWGRGRLPPALCQSTARKPPTHHAVCRTNVPRSIVSRCAPRKNPLFWQPRSHAISSSTSWSKRSSKLGLIRPLLLAHSR
jgi:hypothetical protein